MKEKMTEKRFKTYYGQKVTSRGLMPAAEGNAPREISDRDEQVTAVTSGAQCLVSFDDYDKAVCRAILAERERDELRATLNQLRERDDY